MRPEVRSPPAFGLLLAIALPAAFTFGAGALITQRDSARAESERRPAELAALAERDTSGTPLRPLAAKRGSAALGPLALERLDGGIRPAPPAWISSPAAGIEAAVEPVASPRGRLAVPAVGRAGWYSGGPRPGEYGRAVVIGHLDTKRGPGLFARVPKLGPGAVISVTDGRGDVHDYGVVGTARVHKDRFPTEQVYGPARSPVLVLVTCGGEWLGKDRGGYRDNILLYARALGPGAAPELGRQVGQRRQQFLPLPRLLQPEVRG